MLNYGGHILDVLCLSILDLTAQAIAVLFRNFSPVPISLRLFPTFSSISFSVSDFMWIYLIHLDLTLVNRVSELGGYKINPNKSMAFLYTKDKQDEKEIRETTPFTVVRNNIKYLGVTLRKRKFCMMRTSSL